MDRAAEGRDDPMRLALFDAPDLHESDVEQFWAEFVPMISGSVRETFDTLPKVVAEFRARCSREQRRKFERLLGRFSLILVTRMEPLFLHRGFHPSLPVKSYFHLWMLAHHVIGLGREAYVAAVADPASTEARISSMTAVTGLYALSVFRLEEMTVDAQKLRLLEAYFYPHDPEQKRALAEKSKIEDVEALPPNERWIGRLARAAFGFFTVLPYIREAFKGPAFDHGYPELYPVFTELDSGAVVVKERRSSTSTAPS
jgi:hypothetical protein